MNKKLFAAGLSFALCMAYALIVSAEDKPDVLVKQRQAAMTLQAKYFGPLQVMAQGKVPYNTNLVTQNASYLNVLGKMPWDGFAASTKDVKSRALPEVFKESAQFKKAQEQLQESVGKLVALKGGSEESAKDVITEIGKTCGGCHDHFRQKN